MSNQHKKNCRESVAFVNLGCPKNLVDAEVMGEVLESADFHVIDDPESARIVVVNTCGFIEPAKKESIDEIFSVIEGQRQQILIVAGCLAERYSDELISEIPQISGLIGVNDIDSIDEVVEEALQGNRTVKQCEAGPVVDARRRRRQTETHYGYVKIAAGCSRGCAFCAIPQIRGPYRSKSPKIIHAEVQSLVQDGAKEIILIAQDTASYQLSGGQGLLDLLRSLSMRFSDSWFRIMYVHPSAVSWPLIELLAESKNICSYLDVPLQHSSADVLKRMNRSEDPGRVRDLLVNARKQYPHLSIRATFLVGHPGEKEEDFRELTAFVRPIRPDHTAVFSYSPEENTAAHSQSDQISPEVSRNRKQQLVDIGRQISHDVKQRFVGEILPVLVDERSEQGILGRHQGQAPDIDGYVFLDDGHDLQGVEPGDLVQVEITGAEEVDVWGKVL